MKQGSGKEWSFRTKLFAGVFVVIASLLNWTFRWEIGQGEIIAIGVFIAGLFLPVDLSKLAGNIRGGNGQ